MFWSLIPDVRTVWMLAKMFKHFFSGEIDPIIEKKKCYLTLWNRLGNLFAFGKNCKMSS